MSSLIPAQADSPVLSEIPRQTTFSGPVQYAVGRDLVICVGGCRARHSTATDPEGCTRLLSVLAEMLQPRQGEL